MTTTTLRIRITGRVQGVWFRGWTKQQAEALGLSGWVCNATDGSVLALISGEDAQVSAMVERLWRGPPAAKVREVECEAAEGPVPGGFAVRR
ncbi:acylphosphatase [Oceanibium sediminis]|uniref:acylphosphatase n=1 Tax=Oceanibium sediminis TaxID=2026339 RepID=UPI0018E53DD9|nr:acylphosphatase [Oceanibium sediminis]